MPLLVLIRRRDMDRCLATMIQHAAEEFRGQAVALLFCGDNAFIRKAGSPPSCARDTASP